MYPVSLKQSCTSIYHIYFMNSLYIYANLSIIYCIIAEKYFFLNFKRVEPFTVKNPKLRIKVTLKPGLKMTAAETIFFRNANPGIQKKYFLDIKKHFLLHVFLHI